MAALVIYSLNIPRSREANFPERLMGQATGAFQGQLYRAGGSIAGIWNNYLDLVRVREENRRLQKETKQLEQAVALAGEAIRENERLVKLLELRKSVHEPTVAANIVGEDVTPWFRTLTIDKGAEDGLVEGMPVLAVGGVLGQTIKVGSNNSRVLLLTDHASGIAALIQRSRARGVVKGRSDNLCSLEFTMRDEDVTIGDTVVTSGIGGVFAKGVPIGTVTMVKKGQYGIFQTVTVTPAVRIANLEEVLVVLRKPRE